MAYCKGKKTKKAELGRPHPLTNRNHYRDPIKYDP
jgi:hypothetical protein